MSRTDRSRRAGRPTSSKIASEASSASMLNSGDVDIFQAAAPVSGTNGPSGSKRCSGRRAPPAGQPRDLGRARRGVAVVHEDRPDRARTAVQVLVGAPDGEVDAVVVQRERDVADGVGQVPADDRTGSMAGLRQAGDRQGLAGREVDAVEDDEGQARTVLRDRRLEVVDPDGVLAGPRSDRDRGPRRGPARARRGGCGTRGDRRGRSGRRSGCAAARPAGRKNEASIRWRFTVSVLRTATSLGRAPTRRAIGARNASSVVNHGRPGSKWPSTPRCAQASSSRLDGRPDRPRLEAERLAGEVDRGRAARAVRSVRQQEAVAIGGERVGGVPRSGVGLAGGVRVARQRIVSGPASASSLASSAASGSPCQVADRGDRRRPARVPGPQGRGQVGAVETGRDEPGTEPVAGPDRVERRGHADGRARHGLAAALQAERPVRAELHDRDRRPEVEHGPGEGDRVRRSSEPVTTASSSGLPSTTSACSANAADDRRGLGVAPQAAAEVDVEADRQARAPRQLHGLADRVVRGGRQRRRDPGDVQPAGAGEDAVGRGAVHVHHRDAATRPSRSGRRRPGPPRGRAARAASGRSSPRRRRRGGRRPRPRRAASGRSRCRTRRRRPGRCTRPSGRAGRARPRRSPRHRRRGARSARLGERAGCRGDQRDQALAERDDLGSHQRRASRADATASTTWRARRVTPSATPSPTSQLRGRPPRPRRR